METPYKKLTGKALLIEWQLFCNNPKASGKKLHIKTGYISESGKITYEDTKEFNRALALAKKEAETLNSKNNYDLNSFQKNKKSNFNKETFKPVSNIKYPKKRTINIRPRLRDKELIDYLDKNNFNDETPKKKIKKLMLESGYSVPFQKITEKDIYIFYSAFLEAEKKYRNKNVDNNPKNTSKIIKSNNENSIFEIDKTTPPKANGLTHVYLMRDGKNGTIKIGMSNNVKKRITSIINEYYVWPVELIFCMPFPSRGDAESMESFLHRKYSRYRSFSYSTQSGNTSTEWFNLSKNNVEEIKNILIKTAESRKNKTTKRNFESGDLIAYAFLIIPGICIAITLLPFTIMGLIFWLVMRFYKKNG